MSTVGIMAHPYKKLFKESFRDIIRMLKDYGINIICAENIQQNFSFKTDDCSFMPDEEIPPRCDMILSFGGDGTLLRTIQIVGKHETPVLGVNVGGLGFLTEIPLENFQTICELITQKSFRIEERMVLEGRIEGHQKPMFALNEITIEKGRSTRVIEVKVDINGKYFNDYVADGLIISTPTGSTGYSLSSGGPIVVPTADCIILNPICPHSLTNRPVIIPEKSVIRTQIFTDYTEVIITADNQDIREVPSRTTLHIQRASFNAKLVKHPDSDYFTLLRNKLNWGEDFRDKLRWSLKR